MSKYTSQEICCNSGIFHPTAGFQPSKRSWWWEDSFGPRFEPIGNELRRPRRINRRRLSQVSIFFPDKEIKEDVKNDGNAKMILMGIDNNFGGFYLDSWGNLYVGGLKQLWCLF